MKAKKIIKIILLVLLIIVALFLINTFRKFIIIKNLQAKMSELTLSTNYHIESEAKEENGTIVTLNYYKKDNRQAMLMERNLNGETKKISMYNNGERIDTFIETAEDKIVQLDTPSIMEVNLYNYLETENDWQTFLASMFVKVKKTEYKEKECYLITNFISTMYMHSYEYGEVYIEKDTGLFLKSVMDGIVTERKYEFDNVDDSVFIEPDISQYTIREN